jgi:hypothetical protein
MTRAPGATLLQLLRGTYAALGALLASVALIPTLTLARWFAHPARPGNEGDQVLEATMLGAALLRIMAPIAGVALIALALWRRDTRQRPALEPATRVDAQFLFLAVALAAALRVPLLAESLWYDEIAAFLGYGLHGPGVALGNYYTQANHVFQSVLTSISAELLGASEFSLRLPSLLVGIAAVPAAWWLGREAGSAAAARGAALAMAVMPLAVLESTEARGYAFMAYYATLATASLLWARRIGHGAAWAEYAVVCALGGWSHLVTLCVPAFHGAWCMAEAVGARDADARRTARHALAALAVAALLAAALYSPALPDMLAIRSEFKAADGNEPTLLSAQGTMMVEMLGGTWTWWASLASLPLLVAGIAAARKQRSLAVALCLAMGGVLVALLAPLLNSWLYARFLTFMVPAVALTVGAGGALLVARWPRAGAALSGLAACTWVASLLLLPARQPLREAVDYIAQHRQPQDAAVAIGLPDEVQQFYAHAHQLSIPGTGAYGAHLGEALRAARPQWVLMLYPKSMPAQVHDALRQSGYQAVARFPGWIDQGNGETAVFALQPPAR